ncbi:hypothetical protein N018_13950 [Pseudomonas syringae CC1557]|uniref:Uncharacterized protein n=1 Tax=Pseudomonas syringae CC1557 TaxID=1357279 RepID=W0N2A5_PSESX|nr:hypothetical protein N018_13950 [Pseudomonas syringae CC1557]
MPVLAVVHFDVLTGASQLARLRKASPQQFAALGSHKL